MRLGLALALRSVLRLWLGLGLGLENWYRLGLEVGLIKAGTFKYVLVLSLGLIEP
jgi:hypothetical protein